jgi:hypothetical protein
MPDSQKGIFEGNRHHGIVQPTTMLSQVAFLPFSPCQPSSCGVIKSAEAMETTLPLAVAIKGDKMKRSKELESINWVKAQADALSKKRAESMVRFIGEELGYGLANRQKAGPYSTTEVDNLIDRAFDHAPLPVSKQAIAFEIWNVLHATGVEITYPEKCRYVPNLEGGSVASNLRKLFRGWYEK